MTTTRYFEVKVTKCGECKEANQHYEICTYGLIDTEHAHRRASQRFSENCKKLTDSCPMWNKTKESETI